MMSGYISKRKYSDFEEYLEEYDPKGISFRYRSAGKKAYFFRGDSDSSLCPTYHNSKILFLCEGIPIRGSPDKGYEIIDMVDDEDLKKGFDSFVDEIVSNVSVILFKNGNDPKLYLSSDRAGPGRIYYRYIDKGIAFSSSFSVLLHFVPSRISHEAIYSIMKYSFAPPPLSLSKDVYAVPPSHYVTVDLSRLKHRSYPYFRFCFSEESDFDLRRLDTLLDAISDILSQMNSCVLFSGGVDSTLLVHKMHDRANAGIRSYFLAFGKDDPELTFAKEASESSDSQLNAIFMDESRLWELVNEVAASYDNVFKDICTIPTYYLMKRIVNEREKIIIDGTGGDSCFGFKTIAYERFWNIAYSLPRPLKKLLSSIYSQSGIWIRKSQLEKILETMTKCGEIDVALVSQVNLPPNDVFLSNSSFNETIGGLSMSLVDKLVDSRGSGQIFKQKATVLQILACAGQGCVKTHLKKSFPNVYTLYPYLWKDVLEEQARIPWSAKINKGIVKWPLKRLLESYMSHDFVYRKKLPFDPDFESYIKREKIYNLIKEIAANPKVVDFLINRSRLVKLVKRLPTTLGYSYSLCNFLWGVIFLELWMSKHCDFLTYR